MQMSFETRNEFGYPVADKLESAKQYAAAARERNQPPCPCDACRMNELLPAVQNIINNWK